jgi:hypothetical protein
MLDCILHVYQHFKMYGTYIAKNNVENRKEKETGRALDTKI